MLKSLLFGSFLISSVCCFSQNYTSYFTGNATDVVTSPAGGVCLMGGATEDDNAMTWFLNQANGGDILVIRASGSDGYNDYLYTTLGVSVNSVETIVWNNGLASDDAYIHQKINQAEAIWMAGGDQYNYVDYWRNTPIDSLINKAIEERNIVIGGTSAGMAVLGQAYFSAENGTVTSSTALNNPYDFSVTVDTTDFFHTPFMSKTITDSHYDDPDRKGRHVVFLARLTTDYGYEYPKGIACNEYTAVCVDSSGIARVFGGWPTWDEDAYFVQTICGDAIVMPDCTPGSPLTWNNYIVAYKVHGTPGGTNTFDLNDWETGVGGEWFQWNVDNGILTESPLGYEYDCSLSLNNQQTNSTTIYPNPSTGVIHFEAPTNPTNLAVYNAIGELIISDLIINSDGSLDLSFLEVGVYYLKYQINDQISSSMLIID